MVHGMNDNRSSRGTGAFGIADRLIRHGYGVLVFDLRGHGLCGGKRASGGYAERLDVLGAVDYLQLEKSSPAERIGLIGFSAGGVSVLLAAAEDPSLTAVVADSAYAELSGVLPHEIRDRLGWPDWACQLPLPARRFMIPTGQRKNSAGR